MTALIDLGNKTSHPVACDQACSRLLRIPHYRSRPCGPEVPILPPILTLGIDHRLDNVLD
jgi:hypothetical protein